MIFLMWFLCQTVHVCDKHTMDRWEMFSFTKSPQSPAKDVVIDYCQEWVKFIYFFTPTATAFSTSCPWNVRYLTPELPACDRKSPVWYNTGSLQRHQHCSNLLPKFPGFLTLLSNSPLKPCFTVAVVSPGNNTTDESQNQLNHFSPSAFKPLWTTQSVFILWYSWDNILHTAEETVAW